MYSSEALNIPHWGVIDGDRVAHELGIPRCVLFNDFQCAAYALNGLTPGDIVRIREGSVSDGSVKVMIGVGTGLGISFATSLSDAAFTPFPSEAGWAHFWELSDHDRLLATHMRHRLGTPTLSFEQVCSGPALVSLYDYAMISRSLAPVLKTARDICAAYEACTYSKEAVDTLLEYLGRFVCLMTIIFKPTGGVFLTGGVMDSIFEILLRSESFRAGLTSQTHPILAEIASGPSIFYIQRADVGLLGARVAAASYR